MKMNVELSKLKPNPFREFAVDPIDPEAVAKLVESIEEYGFWGGVICRKGKNGDIQIGAGHHRIEAAKKLGMKTADLFIGDLDDEAMIRVYATENATQRGNSSTAIAGSVASAVRFLAKLFMAGGEVPGIPGKQLLRVNSGYARGHLEGDTGFGGVTVFNFLSGIQGITRHSVEQQLANLKASGDYSRIVKEVNDEVERENKEALEALAKAEKEAEAAKKAAMEAKIAQAKAEEERKQRIAEANARAKKAHDAAAEKAAKAAEQATKAAQKAAEEQAKAANERRKKADAEMAKFDALRKGRDTMAKATANAAKIERTFDFEGVARHLKNENQVRVFRDCVTSDGIKEILPVSGQAALAKKLAESAERSHLELSGQYIRDHIGTLSGAAKQADHQWSKQEREAQEHKDRLLAIANRFKEAAKLLDNAKWKIADVQGLVREHKIKNYAIPPEFAEAVDEWDRAIKALKTKF